MTGKFRDHHRGALFPAPPLWKVARWQGFLLLPVVLVLALRQPETAFSVLLGGTAAILPQAWFARFVFRESGALASQRFFSRLFAGETLKWCMTAVLCLLAFQWQAIRPGVFLSAMAITMMLGWALTLRFINPGIRTE